MSSSTPFRLRPATITLTFEGTEWEGLEVVCRAQAPIADLLYYDSVSRSEGLEVVGEALRRFGDELLVSWNLFTADSDEPHLATGDGLLAIADARLAIAIVTKWGEVVASPAAPLPQTSLAGSSSAEASTTERGKS